MKDLETAAKEQCSKQAKEPSELDRLVLDSKCKTSNVKVSLLLEQEGPERSRVI